LLGSGKLPDNSPAPLSTDPNDKSLIGNSAMRRPLRRSAAMTR